MRASKRQLQEVRRRARRIVKTRGWGYGKAMRAAGWMVAKAAGEKSKT